MPHPFSGCGFFFASPSWNAAHPGMRISVFPGDGAIDQSTRAQSSPRFWRERPFRRPGGSSVNDAPRNASADASRRPDATTAEYSPLDLVKRNQSAPRQVTELTEHRGSPPPSRHGPERSARLAKGSPETRCHFHHRIPEQRKRGSDPEPRLSRRNAAQMPVVALVLS